MPIYEYECKTCGHQFEVRTTSFDIPNPPCPKTDEDYKVCDGDTRKLISRNSFVLKGGGWFKDGYS